ncbi:geranyl transferase [Alteromonas sediminis]|uniref:Geranyl transferase n=2 Tax=Alteromonas sediminis TaxID=2259342 RepID=A0A3N5XZT3_9ALTE|nr:geranyl transferase [Alteromonas sediminis]
MQYALFNGGKRLRPLLAILIADAIEVSREHALSIGAAIECIHAYSLVHDDLPAMDDDDLRRGQPTCHVKYDEAIAILVGDALQSLAFELLSCDEQIDASPSQKIVLINQLAKASGFSGMVGGQAIDLAATGEDSKVAHTIETLMLLHKLKTGAILKACVTMPLALSDKVTTTEKAQFECFADAIGLAFQVQDDILDCTGDTAQLGKPAGSDDEQHKHTFPALLGIEGAKQQLHTLYHDALQALAALPYNTEALEAFCELLINRDH